MKKINERLYNWATLYDDVTIAQAEETSQMPFIFPHVALMPDAHLGKGATIGSVIPTEHAIIPAAVGVDIGCGMLAIRTQFTCEDMLGRKLGPLREAIEAAVPLGRNINTSHTENAEALIAELGRVRGIEQAERVAPNWDLQLGSLGSGNHFIELVYDEFDRVWIFLHSGSRGVGNKLAQKHIKVARDFAEQWFITLPDPDLAYLVDTDKRFWEYTEALYWGQKFAWFNREEMAARVATCLSEFMNEDAQHLQTVHCHHNYTSAEKHYGRNLWISRKGAISAKTGELGLIPGSMGAASYVVEGLGNPLSFHSAPHGAGRVASRRQARKAFDHEDLRKRMASIEWRDSAAFLDEHPDAYKPIDQVMLDARDLVTVKHEFRQFVNVKGE